MNTEQDVAWPNQLNGGRVKHIMQWAGTYSPGEWRGLHWLP